MLRHAKAASDAPWGGGDRERPLTGRGRRDATALGARLAADDPVLDLDGVPRPQHIICSAAVRTRQTADLIAGAMGGDPPLDAYVSLYEAGTDLVLRYITAVDEKISSLLVVGHNPTTYRLVWEMAADDEGGSGGDRAALEDQGFPTCALAVLALDVEAWTDATPGCGRLVGLFKPPY